jgi:hypothetical protein
MREYALNPDIVQSWRRIHANKYSHCDMTPESQNSSLLGSGSLNTYPRKRARATVEERCFLWSAPRALLSSGAVNTFL